MAMPSQKVAETLRLSILIFCFSWGRRGNAEASVWVLRQTISLTRTLAQDDPELSLATLRQARDLIRWSQPPPGPE